MKFSVIQFFIDGSYEQVREYVGAEEATKAAFHYCTSAGAKLGTTVRVIMTDEDDHIAFEWKGEEGITFGAPPHLIGKWKRGFHS